MLYLSYKYHANMASLMSFSKFSGRWYTEMSLYREMEYYIISKALNYEIYMETMYEAADSPLIVLSDCDIGNLINHTICVHENSSIHGLHPCDTIRKFSRGSSTADFDKRAFPNLQVLTSKHGNPCPNIDYGYNTMRANQG